jgi:hypothetical protein
MFFWLYAVIELLAIFLDSGIIPTASTTYPVCRTFSSFQTRTPPTTYSSHSVVRSCLYWIGCRDLLLHPCQRFCRLPICRRWHAAVTLGEKSSVGNTIGVSLKRNNTLSSSACRV